MIGQTINNYILERKLGEGGMGNVYFARHNRIDRIVAIKVLHKTLFTHINIRNRFKNEANALIKLGHPNIVKIYDYVEQDDIACLIMEYIEGFTLDDYITKVTGPLPAPKATNIIFSVLDAVQYAHDKNIFHRDIKPGNIMISKDGKTIKIMDFGIAKFTDASNLKTTHANAQLGTPFYMSPEQVKGIAYTALSDIYSLGVTLFEMVTGKCPYQEITNLFELQSKIINETLPPTGKYYPDVTLKIQEAIRIATNKIPEKRFKSCNEFKRFLLEEEKVRPFILQEKAPVLQPKLPQPRTKTLPPPVNPPRLIEEKKKNNSWAFWLILFSILIVGGLIYSFHNQSNTTINQPKVTLTPPIKKDPTSGLITKHHDTLASAGKLSDSPGAKINEAENKIKINTQALSESKKQKIIPKENVISVLKGKKIQIKNANSRKKKTFPPDTTITQPLLSTTQLPPPTIHNVKGDLMHYLEQRKKFGGIQYNDISVINITSIGDVEYYKQSGNTSFLVELTIYNIARKCQVTYSQGGIIQIKPL